MGAKGSKSKKGILIKGFLKKQAGTTWNARFFILKQELLLRYDDKPNLRDFENDAKETINMSDCTVVPNTRAAKPFSFTILERDNPVCVLAAKDTATMNRWLKALRSVSLKVSSSPATTNITTQPATPYTNIPQPIPQYAPQPNTPQQPYHPQPTHEYSHYQPPQYPDQYPQQPTQYPPQNTQYPPQQTSQYPDHSQSEYAAYLQHASSLHSYNPDYQQPSAPPSAPPAYV